MDRTFALIKPDAVATKKAGAILARIEQEGFTIRGMRLMRLSKAETWKLAADLGTVRRLKVLETVREMSHTDYNGDRSERHAWGYGRLDNPASVLRAKGYEEAKARGWV